MSGPYERSDRDAEIVLQCQSKWLYQYIFTARKLVVMQDLLLPSHSQRSHDHLMTRQQSQHWWSMGWEMGGNIDNLHSIIARVAIWNCCSLLYIERSMFNISGWVACIAEFDPINKLQVAVECFSGATGAVILINGLCNTDLYYTSIGDDGGNPFVSRIVDSCSDPSSTPKVIMWNSTMTRSK